MIIDVNCEHGNRWDECPLCDQLETVESLAMEGIEPEWLN